MLTMNLWVSPLVSSTARSPHSRLNVGAFHAWDIQARFQGLENGTPKARAFLRDLFSGEFPMFRCVNSMGLPSTFT